MLATSSSWRSSVRIGTGHDVGDGFGDIDGRTDADYWFLCLAHSQVAGYRGRCSEGDARHCRATGALVLLPGLFVSLSQRDDVTSVAIQNVGQHAAHDVEILVVQKIFDSEHSLASFLTRHVPEPKRYRKKLPAKLIDQEIYGLVTRCVYANFPARRKVVFDFPLLVAAEHFDVCLQFRDPLGNNYLRTYWFMRENRWRLGHMAPPGDALSERLELFESPRVIPKNEVARKFARVFDVSIRIGHTNLGRSWSIEDAGTWSDA